MLKRTIEIECTAEEMKAIASITPRMRAQYLYTTINLYELVRDMQNAGMQPGDATPEECDEWDES